MIDFTCRTISVGDTIVYAALAGRCAVLHRGLVLGFKSMEPGYCHPRPYEKIKVEIEGWNKKPKIVYLEFPERVIVVQNKAEDLPAST